jgi:hypothetical protein
MINIKRIIYRLKREFGKPISLQWHTSNGVNRATGMKSVTYENIDIKRAIVLPNRLHRDFTYDLAFIGENKNFTYGAYFHTSERHMIIDSKDMPADFKIKLDYWTVFEDRRWDVKVAQEFDQAWYILVKEVEGSDANALRKKLCEQDLILTSEVSYVVE